MQLVGAQGEEIDTELTDIELDLARDLHGIGVAEHTLAAADGCNLGDREQHAGLVVGVHARNDRGIGPDRFLQTMNVERTVALHRKIGHIETPALQEVAVVHVRRVFDGGGDHVLLARIHHQGAVDRRVVRLGAAAREGDFLRIGIQQRRHLLTRLLHMPVHLGAKSVGAGGVAPEVRQEREHRFHDFGGDARGRVVIEINDFFGSSLAHGVGGKIKPDQMTPLWYGAGTLAQGVNSQGPRRANPRTTPQKPISRFPLRRRTD